jgi:lipopolysaccharide transport system permease protein
MLAYNYFNSAVGRAANSLKHDAPILAKIYFPRVVLPVSNVISPLVDLGLGLVVLVAILLVYQHPPSGAVVLLPLFLLLGMVCALGLGLGLAGLNAYYRDVQHVLPVALHLLFFCSPVLYSSDLVPAQWRLLYAVNPMVSVCEGVRWCSTGFQTPLTAGMVAVSSVSALVLLVVGSAVFMRLEQTVTDVL